MTSITSKELDQIIEQHRGQPAGTGYVDVIVPRENYKAFVRDILKCGIQIEYISWWEYVSDVEESGRYGMGGPISCFGPGWYSEMCMGDDDVPPHEEEVASLEAIESIVENKVFEGRVLVGCEEVQLGYKACTSITPSFCLAVNDRWKPDSRFSIGWSKREEPELKNTNFMQNKIPPPVVLVLFACIMWGLSAIGPVWSISFPIKLTLMISLSIFGLGVAFAGMAEFKKSQTTINPLQPQLASTFVSSGVFRYTRNPMYLGLVMLLAAWAIYLSTLSAFLCLPVFVLYMNLFQIAPEERALTKIFGAEYRVYLMKVRKWI